MNERIRELADEAGFYVSANGAEILIPDPYTEDITGVMEKFAELIVRDCIDITSPYAVRMENFDGGHPIAEIKQHFGVRE